MSRERKLPPTPIKRLIEGNPLLQNDWKCLSFDTLLEWVEQKHPELQDTIIRFLEEEVSIANEFKKIGYTKMIQIEDLEKPRHPVKRRKTGTVEMVPVKKSVCMPEDERRKMSKKEISEWVCRKYGMFPEKTEKVNDRQAIANKVRNWGTNKPEEKKPEEKAKK